VSRYAVFRACSNRPSKRDRDPTHNGLEGRIGSTSCTPYDSAALSHKLGWPESEMDIQLARCAKLSFKHHRFPADIIRHSVWLYARFTLS